MRRTIQRAVLPAIALVSLLSSTLSAVADTESLIVGGECYGAGESNIVSTSYGFSKTDGNFACQGSAAFYLESAFVFEPSGSEECGYFWASYSIYCQTTVELDTIASGHNLCYYYCNGMEYTVDRN